MENATPMLRQYLEIKKLYPGTILFFRLGDFYEMFNEDAIVGSRELQITLTARQKDSKNPIPMCGVPHHAAANYISRLVKKGYRVAICEQAEAAGKGVKLVKREVVRVITPGTAIDPQLVESDESVYLASVCGHGETFGAAFLELSTGEFSATQVSGPDAWTKICERVESFSPRELLYPEPLKRLIEQSFGSGGGLDRKLPVIDGSEFYEMSQSSMTLTSQEDTSFHVLDCDSLLKKQFGVNELTGFGLTERAEAIRAAGAALRYAQETQRTSAAHISSISYFESNEFLVLDAVTLRNLEIVESQNTANKRFLFNVLNETVTGMGSRLLRSWLIRPSIKRSEIQTADDALKIGDFFQKKADLVAKYRVCQFSNGGQPRLNLAAFYRRTNKPGSQ